MSTGAPETIGEAQKRLEGAFVVTQRHSDGSENIISQRIGFQCPKDALEFIDECKTVYDVAVLAHCIWYFASPSVLLATLRALSSRAKRICIAEWSLTASEPSAFPHVLAVLAMASLECRKSTSTANVRTVLSPERIKEMAAEVGLVLESEAVFTTPRDMLDDRWEVSYSLSDHFERKVGKFVKDERERGVVCALLDAVRANTGSIEDITSMDVWSGTFKGVF